MPVLWTVYQAPYTSAGNRFMVVRTAKSLTYVAVGPDGKYGDAVRYNRPLTYEWRWDWEAFERDFRTAMQRPYKEKPRWRQLDLAFEWPREPVIIQLQFRFDWAMAA